MNSKLGFHIQQRRPGWPNAVADALPALVKSLEWRIIDDWLPDEQADMLQAQRARKWQQANVFLLGRHVVAEQHLDEPEKRAIEFWDRLLADLTHGDARQEARVLERMRHFDAWEGYNEIGSGPIVANLGRFDAYLARRFHTEGLRYAGGGFSMTKPTSEEWLLYCRALLDTVDLGQGDVPDFLHFHEYWYPPEDWASLLHADGSINPRRMRAATKGYMLHWRDLYEHPDTPAEIKLPVIISECGWDRGWPEQVGFRESSRSDADYVAWLLWYDQELQKPLDGIDYVVGAAIFTYGHEARWASFEIDQWQGRGVLGALRAYLREQNQEPHPRDWRAAWERLGHGDAYPTSHFVLFAENVSLPWRNALSFYLNTFRVTSGQSLEDSLRLATAHHHITLVGSADCAYGIPAAWEEELRRRAVHRQIALSTDRMEARTARELRRIADGRVQRNDPFGRNDPLPRSGRALWRRLRP